MLVEENQTQEPGTDAQAPTPEQESASLQAGFDAVRATSPEDDSAGQDKAADKQQEPEAAPEAAKTEPEEKPVEEPIVLAGMTESQIKSALAKAMQFDDLRGQLTKVRDQAMGKVGQLEQELKKGNRLQITGTQFKRLEQELGPEIAQAIADDFGDILGKADDAAKAEEAKPDAQPTAQVVDVERIKGEIFLETKHSDWQTKMASDDFALWMGVLPPEQRQAVASSADPRFIASALDAFSSWKGKSKQATTEKQTRLARATNPQGAGGVTQSVIPDEQGLSIGFNKIRKRA